MKKSQKGFAVVEGLLILVIVGLIGFVGWYVWHNRATKTTNSPATSTSAIVEQKTTPTATKPAVDPYAGWKTYCDSTINGCFRYPADWADIGAGTDVKALGTNKDETIVLEYAEPVNGNGGLGDFLTKSIDSLTTTDTTYKVVGGYYTIGNIPGYNLADTSLTQQLGLSVGKTTKISNNDLYFTKNSSKATLVAHYDNTSGSSSIAASVANPWFTSTDGKIALKIVQSYYVK